MAKTKIDVPDLVSYFKYTSLNISSYLRDRKLPASMEGEVEVELRKHLVDCSECGVWDSKSNTVDGKCVECDLNE